MDSVMIVPPPQINQWNLDASTSTKVPPPQFNQWTFDASAFTKEYFSQRSVANSSQIRKNLNEIFHGTRTVSEYLQETKTYTDTLATIGEPIKNIDLVNAILCDLGSKYEMLITALEILETLPQISALHSRLLIYESHHRASAPLGPSALLASHASSQNYYKGKKGKNTYKGPSQYRTDTPGILGAHPTVGFCQLSHGIGHFASTYPMLPRFDRPQMISDWVEGENRSPMFPVIQL
ncbi:hypothetical protein IFM89_036303 [Coptis chinensis]|uniref:Uncharacterized protein n=1 Tax=Coptis chinensis TaxID=261450 RepID=A0A835IJ38_9MAGN|nr:hypothetical protein IFM89_036303 [Coptis chinensis]